MHQEPPLRQGPPPPVKVTWRVNERRRQARMAAYISLAMAGGLFALTGLAIAAGDRNAFTLFAFVISLFLLDGAVSRLLLSRKAPVAIGLSEYGVHVRMAAREIAAPWGAITDIRFASVGPRPDTMLITLRNAQIMQYSNVLPAIASEIKLAWFEAEAKARAASRGTRARVVRERGGAVVVDVLPPDLLPSGGPQYWVSKDHLPSERAGEGGPIAPPPPTAESYGRVVAADAPQAQSTLRPEWGYTKPLDGSAVPDPLYHSPPSSVRPLVWHFVPSGNTRSGLFFLLALVLLAGIAVARIAADALLSLAGYPSDPWTATVIGLIAGGTLAAIIWGFARAELTGEVAGSVMFLPAFDRTKVELVAALRDAGEALGAGEAMERRSRGRLTLQWRQNRTRAVIVQAAPDMRAIWLRTVGSSHFEMHARLKGAILAKLGGNPPRK